MTIKCICLKSVLVTTLMNTNSHIIKCMEYKISKFKAEFFEC